MAWQTPKTDWSAADGVRDTDFNRIEENILELRNTESLKDTLLVHVATTGNDTTGAGTAAAPYRTITKALSVIPKNLGGKNASITIGAGTYSEAVTISGFSGGGITLTGVTNAVVAVTSLTVNGCVCNITSLKVTTTAATGVTVTNGGSLIATGEITCSGSGNGIRVMGCSRLHLAGTATITNASNAIEVTNCSSAYVGTLAGSNVTIGMNVSAGSTLAYGTASIVVKSTLIQTTSGGRVFTGVQATSGAPTTSTVGAIGQLYLDADAQELYYCCAADTTEGCYTWAALTATSVKVNTTLSASGWSTAKKYTLSNANITATSAVELLPRENNGITQAQMEALSGAMIVGGTQAAGSIQLVALGDVPTVDIPVTLIIRRDL